MSVTGSERAAASGESIALDRAGNGTAGLGTGAANDMLGMNLAKMPRQCNYARCVAASRAPCNEVAVKTAASRQRLARLVRLPTLT